MEQRVLVPGDERIGVSPGVEQEIDRPLVAAARGRDQRIAVAVDHTVDIGATIDQQIATGFNRNNATTDEGGAIAEEYRVEYVVDRVKTTSMVWMGLSLECAQCHNHKYDPFTQQDYYQLFAYFNNTPLEM